jgi:hypothetical protein
MPVVPANDLDFDHAETPGNGSGRGAPGPVRPAQAGGTGSWPCRRPGAWDPRCPRAIPHPAGAARRLARAAGKHGLPAGGFLVRLYRVTGPEARMTRWKATGGVVCEHLPPDFARIARRLAWYLPSPVIPV